MAKNSKIKKSEQQPQQRTYGIFSMLALVVGVVIGSGIFVKNGAVFGSTGSAIMSIVTWVIVTLVIMLMVFAYVEIASSGKKSGKPGTLSGWITDFINPKLGKWVGIFIMFAYFPPVLAMFPMWAADNVMVATGTNMMGWDRFASTIGIGLAIFAVVFFMNLYSKKGQDAIGQTGMGLKLVPLFTVIIAAIVFISIGTMNGSKPDPGFPVDAPENLDGKSMFEGIMLAMPAILFTYDGFVFSASMQNEAKSDKTFLWAWVGGMLFVGAIYIGYSVSVFASNALTLDEAIKNLFGASTSQWLAPTMEAIVIISIISGFQGQYIGASKSHSALSAEKVVVDVDGTLMKYNHRGHVQYAGYRQVLWSAIWLVLFIAIDAINIHIQGVSTFEGYFFYAGDFQTNIGAVLAFMIYAVIMIGGIMNRKTNKVEVDKKWYFLPTAIISASALLFIAGFQMFDIFRNLFTNAGEKWYEFVVLAATIGTMIGIYYYQEYKWKAINIEEYDRVHIPQAQAYLRQEIAPEFKTGANVLRTK